MVSLNCRIIIPHSVHLHIVLSRKIQTQCRGCRASDRDRGRGRGRKRRGGESMERGD